ncbi:MAG: hypothetical protein HY905_02845 [Deltaproteobacteria bacterium]|nr:hypothetical protein [Deltaproteobacteria bacterium]
MAGPPGGILFAMERIVHVARDFREARAWDIEQHVSMTPEQRQRAAKELRDRVYGPHCPDVRDVHGRP